MFNNIIYSFQDKDICCDKGICDSFLFRTQVL